MSSKAPPSPPGRLARQLAGVLLAGSALALGLAMALEMTPTEGVRLATTAGAGAVVAGVLGAVGLRRTRHTPVGTQTTVVAFTAVASVAAGSLGAARSMFFSTHDLHALAVVLVAAATVAVATALVLGDRVARASRHVDDLARQLGEGAALDDGGATGVVRGRRPGAGELDSLAARLRETSARLEESRARLEESRRHERALEVSRRELVAWVSHDLRTPLAAIRAMVEALEDRVVSDPVTVARYHQTLRQEADRLALLVDDLFELSRLQSGALALQIERACLADLVSDAVAASRPVATAKGVRLEGRVDGTVPELDLSSAEVARALRNLLENAIRHTPSDGSVVVDVGVEADRVVVSVADGCGGIPEADLERVFEPAFRGEAARSPSRDGGGAGLGLAIVRGIVEAHHGEVDVSNAGEGCRFVVRLPLVRAPAG